MRKLMPRDIIPSRAAVVALVSATLVAFSAWTFEIPSLAQSRADSLKDHVRYLASEELTGRGVDTPGIKLARDYIAREFAKIGLRPGGDNGSYLQGFDVAIGVAVKQTTNVAFGKKIPPVFKEKRTPPGPSRSCHGLG